MIAELQNLQSDIQRTLGRTLRLAGGSSRDGEVQKWDVRLPFKTEFHVFTRRLGITFRDVFQEWRRWGWPITSSITSISALSIVSNLSIPFGDIDAPTTTSSNRYDASPNVDVIRRDEQVFVRLHAPGLRREDIRVEFFDGVLMLKGTCAGTQQGHTDGEIGKKSTFFYNVTLPAGITVDNAQIELGEDGLGITILLPGKQGREEAKDQG